MNKWEKEVQQSLLDSEESAIKELEKQYNRALKDINEKVKLFDYDISMLDEAINSDGVDDATKAMLQSRKRSKIYQKQYQEALKGQVSGILDKLQSDEYSTIDSYLRNSYTDSFVGTMYSIAGQGVPMIIPIDQAAAVKAILTDSKISKGLYNSLGVDVKGLKKSISAEISRGIASGLSYSDISRNISNVSKAPLSRAKVIARTEGHRIQQASTHNAQQAAKAKGADVVKQWDSTLDGKTRDTHRQLDGQIRELDEFFEADGKKARYPGDFGDPAEDCNCRCVSLTRAKWALDDEELETLKSRAEYFGLDKTKDFEDYKKKYIETTSDPKYTILEKVNYSGNVTPEIEADLEKKISMIPENHRRLAETQIARIEIIDNPEGSGYDPNSKVIYSSTISSDPYAIIHEYAHGLQQALNVYGDPQFKKIMLKGLENITITDVIEDDVNFTKPIYRIENDKFISLYQGRLYPGFYSGGDSFNLDTMFEYFSEGYKEFVVNPDNLKKHDPDVFGKLKVQKKGPKSA